MKDIRRPAGLGRIPRRIGAGLGGGSGRVLPGFNLHTRQLENYWMVDLAKAGVVRNIECSVLARGLLLSQRTRAA